MSLKDQIIIIGQTDSNTDRQLRKYKDILSYRNDAVSCEGNSLYRSALAKVYESAKRKEAGRIPIVHLFDLWKKGNRMVDWTASSGLPWCNINSEGKNYIQNNPAAINGLIKFWYFSKGAGQENIPSCLVKTGTGKEWTYPATVSFGEATFVVGLMKAFSEQGDSSIIAHDYIFNADGKQRLCTRFHAEDKFYIKLSFNENAVPAWLIHDIFRLLWTHIDFSRYAGGGRSNAVKMFQMLERIEKYFINTTILLPNEIKVKKSCGIPQGSCLSELVSSFVSLILLEYLSYHFEGKCTEDKIAYGNESIARIGKHWDLNECERIIKSVFGITLNVRECKVTKYIKSIQFLTNNKC